ncbi:hypothetical protein [Roseovarius ramblicola]|uniref:Uncharacterized protein n=1 Tax=Roseovarius ramblicola TaxID=2022336 RepID=A0ABV5I0E6_9RHOB
MSLDGFLTFVGLMIATYAILTPVSRLRLRLNLFRQLVLATASISLIGFFEFYFELKSVAPPQLDWLFDFVPLESQTSGLTHQEAAFLVIVTWILLAWVLYISARPQAISLKTLKNLVETLHDEDRFLETAELVEPYFPIIKKAVKKQLLGQGLHNWIIEVHRSATSPFPMPQDYSRQLIPNSIARRILPVASIIPSRKGAYQNASDIVQMLQKSDGMQNLLLRLRPGFAIKLMGDFGWEDRDFRTKYFRGLINDKFSHFYKEIRHNQTCDNRFGYYIDPKNIILSGLFSDTTVASKYGIYKPIGDEIISLIQTNTSYRKTLNSACPNEEDDLWLDPTYCAIRFFDIMVTSAAKQETEDHMWLMYMSVFVRELSKSYDPVDDRTDIAAEFPTLGTRLIYEAIYCLRQWTVMAIELPDCNPHASEAALEGGNGISIPYWAAMDASRAMRYVADIQKLPARFKSDMLEGIVRDLVRLPREGYRSCLRRQLILELVRGGSTYPADDRRTEIRRLLSGIDQVLTFDAEDLMAALNAPD